MLKLDRRQGSATNAKTPVRGEYAVTFSIVFYVQKKQQRKASVFFTIMKFQKYLKKKSPAYKDAIGLKKTFIRGFTVKPKLAFCALTKKRRFSRPLFDPT